ncbi:MAG: site-specific integrase [Bacteroidetes bacterium]|nr:site-specific integrase [Bacteroidota bacterium]
MATLKGILSNYKKDDGSQSVMVRITHNREIKRYPLDIVVKSKDFDTKKGLVKKSHINHLELNFKINDFIDKAERTIYNIENTGTSFSFRLFEDLNFSSNETFKAYLKQFIERKNYAKATKKSYLSIERKFKKFVGSNYDNLLISDIDYKMLSYFKAYLVNDYKNATNTVTTNIKKICSVLNDAELRDIIKKSPASKVRNSYEPGKREYLTPDELNKLEKFYNTTTSERLKKALKPYLFSCYTGISYVDVKNLKYSDIEEGVIRINRQKTAKPVVIPLSKYAKNYIDTSNNGGNQPVFPKLISNQKMNDYLKGAVAQAQIEKNITYHTSRHTFATVSLSLGIPIEYVKDLLGHSSVQITEIYAKIIADDTKKQMLKWDNL